MLRTLFPSLRRREEGGISTYVAQAVMILAVLSIAIPILASTTRLGQFIRDSINNFIQSASP